MWSLRDNSFIGINTTNIISFLENHDALYQAPSYASPTSNCVHHGKSLWQYLEEGIIHLEDIEVAKHFKY